MDLKDFVLIRESNKIIQWTIIIFIIIAIIYLLIVSIIVKDFKYPKEHPFLFTIETLLFSLGCGYSVFLMAYGRNNFGLTTIFKFIYNVAAFCILFILLQFSGFYSYLFNYKTS